MISNQKFIEVNRQIWDLAAPTTDTPRSNLPFWGPYAVGAGLNLLPEIENKVCFEIGCGSGRSLEYLLENGARRVYGLDLSRVQIDTATAKLKRFGKTKFELFCMEMEQFAPILNPVDLIISLYALGWTYDLDLTLSNIHSYLKPGGKLIFSWEHPIFNRTWFDGEKIIVDRNYFLKGPQLIENFRQIGPAYLFTRTLQDWIKAIIRNGFDLIDYFEPAPVEILDNNHPIHANYYADQKALNLPCTMIFVCQKL